jgi:hypothetical protein
MAHKLAGLPRRSRCPDAIAYVGVAVLVHQDTPRAPPGVVVRTLASGDGAARAAARARLAHRWRLAVACASDYRRGPLRKR